MRVRYYDVIRWILTIILIYLVYTETGAWTTIYVFLNSVTIEMMNFVLRNRK